nr:OmpH family outer membrane protein [Fulvivirga lutimaris]
MYVLHFSKSDGSTVSDSSEVAGGAAGEYSVVYINSDSVLSKYDYFKDIQDKFQEKGQKLEKEYQNRAQGLQQEVNDYQRTVSNLTIGQAKALEENLMKKQQNLRLYQESLSQELLKEEAKMNQELYEKVTAFLKDYSAANGIDLVVKYNQGSDVLFATKGMDITEQVVKGLNEAYANESTEPATVAADSTAKK